MTNWNNEILNLIYENLKCQSDEKVNQICVVVFFNYEIEKSKSWDTHLKLWDKLKFWDILSKLPDPWLNYEIFYWTYELLSQDYTIKSYNYEILSEL